MDPATRQDQTERSWRSALLGWLTFAEIDDRREQVQKAHEETFKWIFKDGNETGFATWLSSGDGIFWVHGKPASGKSTLLKYITREGRLIELLQIWSGQVPPVVASYYFWNAGSELQRSLVGLYRSLIHQILKADEHMCRAAFPEWQERFAEREPTIEMLTVAMDNILSAGSLSKNFFFIIDGLDEYDRDSMGKTQLAELMLHMSQSPRVKLLISSRPETPFKNVFRQCRTLNLESLTASDIETFVKRSLWSNPFVRSISDVEGHSINEIATFILDNAQGVFLWVVLAIRIALDGINNHEDVSVVRDGVMLLPPELDQLFTHILTQRIPRKHRQEALRCLYIAFIWHSESVTQFEPKDLSYTIVSIARQASTYAKACSLAHSTVWESPELSKERLANRCQGLLEVIGEENDSIRVTFLHRTLLDYLKGKEEANLLPKTELGDAFDVYTAIMAGIICACRKYKYGHNYYPTSSSAWKFFYLNSLAEDSTGQPRSELIVMLDRLEASISASISDGRHWSAVLLHYELSAKSDLLSWSACCGASKHVQKSIENGEISSTHGSTLLLNYALMPIAFPEAMYGQWPVEPRDDLCTLLLDNGANPAYEIDGLCPWLIVLNRIVTDMRMKQHTTQQEVHETSVALRVLGKFARKAPDLQKCSAIKSTASNDQYTASDAMRELVLDAPCCPGFPVSSCRCHKAQIWTLEAMQVLSLLGSTRASYKTQPVKAHRGTTIIAPDRKGKCCSIL